MINAYFNNLFRISLNTCKNTYTVSRKFNIFFSQRSTKLSPAMAAINIQMSSNEIIKSAEDKRLYRGLILNNGMKVLLISDPSTDKSSAAMDVNIGSLCDPDQLPGLAHFCEHMLFLGTEKYPEENEYNKFLNEHGGSSNAFTSAEHTNFYFDVNPDNLGGAMDRFAQFFISPLFTASATEREVNAVNSENDKNLQTDYWRLYQLEKSTCNPKHPFSKFATGNKDTLDTIPKQLSIDVRTELLKFHDAYYSSDIMSLAVLGKESLDELTDLTVPLFSAVKNRNVTSPEWGQPCGPEELKILVKAIPVKDFRSVGVTWPIPDLHPFYKTNPGHYLGHLIGHEGPGSLLSELKNRGWINSIVGGQKQGAKGFMFFIVNADLTEEGIEHVDDIVLLIFQYLNLLRKMGPQEWVFQECRKLSEMTFRFKGKEQPQSYTSSCASLLHDYPLFEVLCGGYLMDEYKPELFNMVLEKLTPNNIRMAVIGQKFSNQTDKTERWYGTQYRIEKLSEETLRKWTDAGLHDNLKLPLRNEFIPTNFDILPRDEEPATVPKVICDTAMKRVWYKQDDKFLLPKALINVEFTSPYAYMDPPSANMSYMFVSLFKDALTEYSYDAELAGLTYELQNTIYGLNLFISGYNDKQPILLKKIMEKMTSFQIDQQRFEILKEKYIRGLKNFRAEQPHQHAIYYTTVVTSEQMWTKDELLEATEELTVQKLESFIPQLLSKLYLEFLIYGNVTKEVALNIADIVEEQLKSCARSRALLPSQQRRFREVQLPDGCYYVYKMTNEVHKSSSLEVYYQCNVQETSNNILLELFCQVIGEPCFDILRTQEQLGYIVFSGVRRACGVQGLRVIVQSDRSPDYIETRIEAFLKKMGTYLAELTPEAFAKHVEALACRRLEKPKKLSMQNGKYWSEITSQQYHFDRDELEVATLRSVTKDDLINFYKELIAYDAPRRHKLSVHVTSTSQTTSGASPSPVTVTSADVTENDENGVELAQEGGFHDVINASPGLEAEEELEEVLKQGLPTCPSPTPVIAPVIVDYTDNGLPPGPQPCVITDLGTFKRELGLFPLPRPYIQLASAKSKL